MDLVTMDRPSLTPQDDRSVVRAYDFLRELNRAGGDQDKQRRVQSRFPHTYDAYILYREGGKLRDAVEAMLLADVSMKDMRKNFGLEPEVIRAFRDLWFDVPLDEEGQIRVLLSLVPEAYADGFDPRDTDGFWKAIARMRMPEKLVNVMNILAPVQIDEQSFAEMMREALQRKALEAALRGGLDEKTIQGILQSLTEVREEGEPGELPRAWQEAVYEAYLGFKWEMAVDREGKEAESPADGPPDDAAERRSEEPPADD